MAELDISPQAQQDLVEIRLYSLEHFGPDAADAYFAGLDQAFDRLAQHIWAHQGLNWAPAFAAWCIAVTEYSISLKTMSWLSLASSTTHATSGAR